MLTWPRYARIAVDGYRLGWAAPVRRVPLDDGMVRQARTGHAMQRTIDCEVLVASDAERSQFDAWVAQLETDWALLPAGHGGPEGAPRLARIAGGRGGVQWTSEVTRSKVRYWRASMRLESPERYLYRDLWDPLLPVGDLSHVYWRLSATLQSRNPNRSTPAGPVPTERQFYFLRPAPPYVPVAPSIIEGAAPAYVSQLVMVRRPPPGAVPWKLRLSSRRDGSETGVSPGPDIRSGLLAGMRLALRIDAATYVTPPLSEDAGDDEPYDFGRSDYVASNAFLAPLAAVEGISPIVSAALIWTGAGSVIDLTALRSIPTGRAPA